MSRPVNDNGAEATEEEVLIVDGFVFKLYSLANGKLIVDADDVHGFFNSPTVTVDTILKLKKAVEERIDARTQHSKAPRVRGRPIVSTT